MPSARDRRKTRVESRKPIVNTRENRLCPSTLRIISAQIKDGIDSTTSTRREMTVSTHLPVTAATRPSVMPSAKDRIVVTNAMPIVIRAPKIRRENMSRPI